MLWQPRKAGLPGVVPTYHPSIWEIEAEGPGVQGQPELVRPCLNKTTPSERAAVKSGPNFTRTGRENQGRVTL